LQQKRSQICSKVISISTSHLSNISNKERRKKRKENKIKQKENKIKRKKEKQNNYDSKRK